MSPVLRSSLWVAHSHSSFIHILMSCFHSLSVLLRLCSQNVESFLVSKRVCVRACVCVAMPMPNQLYSGECARMWPSIFWLGFIWTNKKSCLIWRHAIFFSSTTSVIHCCCNTWFGVFTGSHWQSTCPNLLLDGVCFVPTCPTRLSETLETEYFETSWLERCDVFFFQGSHYHSNASRCMFDTPVCEVLAEC